MAEHKINFNWWKNAVVYNVYLPSFSDGNGDGIGDFKGLTSALSYFKSLCIKTLMLSPFFPSPMYDNGYDVTDYCSIDSKYGTMEDFDKFIEKAKAEGLNIIIDLPINHTSYQHKWFVESIQRKKPYTDYYIWAEPRFTESDVLPPNNWISVFGGSAWEFRKERDQFYLHQFLTEQPDLNLRNPDVKKEIKEIFLFWLEKGVDGFRIDAASHLIEDVNLWDEPCAEETSAKPDEYEYLDHIHTKGQTENLGILSEWHDLLMAFSVSSGKYKLLLAEVTEDLTEQVRYYGDDKNSIADIPFNFALTKLDSTCTPSDLELTILSCLNELPPGKVPNWVVGNHDLPRLTTRFGHTLLAGIEMLILLLPGVVFWYYGDELGMENVDISFDDMKDTFALRTKPENSRDPCRTPMQWNNREYAGFSNSNPWLPLSTNYDSINVEAESTDSVSPLTIFRKLMKLRIEPSVQEGSVEFPHIDSQIFSMLRSQESHKSFLVVVNMGVTCCTVDFKETCSKLPEEAFIEVSNNPYLNDVSNCEEMFDSYIKKSTVTHVKETGHWKFKLDSVYIIPSEAMVLSFEM